MQWRDDTTLPSRGRVGGMTGWGPSRRCNGACRLRKGAAFSPLASGRSRLPFAAYSAPEFFWVDPFPRSVVDEIGTLRPAMSAGFARFSMPPLCLAGRRGRHGKVRRGCPKFEGSIATGAIRWENPPYGMIGKAVYSL